MQEKAPGLPEPAVPEPPPPPPLQKTRWLLALLVTAGALAVTAYWLVTGKVLACTVTTTAGTAVGSLVSRTCSDPPASDYLYVLAVVAVLLLPDAKSLKIGGLEFHRLNQTVEQQTREISRLSQNVSQTISIGTTEPWRADLVEGFRELMARLALVRGVLPDDPLTAAQLARLDELAGLLDSAPVTEVLAAVTPAEGLIQAARQIAATVAASTATVSPEEAARAPAAADVIGAEGDSGAG